MNPDKNRRFLAILFVAMILFMFFQAIAFTILYVCIVLLENVLPPWYRLKLLIGLLLIQFMYFNGTLNMSKRK